MTRVDFHFNAPDKIGYGCRLVRKIHRAGQKVVVCGADMSLLERLDEALWTFSALEFIPHVWVQDALAAETPVVLSGMDGATERLPHHEVLVNLGGAKPPWFASFERLIEVVSDDETDRAAARERWRFYRERGYALHRHDLSSGG